MKKLFYLIVSLLFIQCTGEISVHWGIEWILISESSKSFSKMEYEFYANNIDAEHEFFNHSIDESGNLSSTFNVCGHNHKEVREIYPNIEFTFILSMDTTILMDTVFSWEDMEFVGNVSEKEIIIP